MSEMIRKRVPLSGRVQGVGFRYFTRQASSGQEVAGFVRNLPDGRVEVEAQGPQDEVDRFLGNVRIGPPGSRIDEVSVETIPVRPEDDGFDIRF